MLLSVAVGDEDGPADSVLGVVGGAAVSSVPGSPAVPHAANAAESAVAVRMQAILTAAPCASPMGKLLVTLEAPLRRVYPALSARRRVDFPAEVD
ncbi:hypothetical protein ASH00_06485 [Arthrobacter sp. Soil782]|uniref:hypothetical protein n=1 Tax=Arthrobacter sp. Soil782 TaxID=1736410 RepID=UPI0006FA9088|nr:hypothetical protein [Arthrobacter sp. Soil782]KRF09276.1 hypothetical protein ASH00_06485 [Arthrobacter sp. Soil782]